MIAQVVKRFTCPRLIFCPLLPMAAQLLPMAAQPSGRDLPDPCILLQAATTVNPGTLARKPVLQSRTEV